MKRTAIVYKSAYGATEQYAKWLSDALGAELIPHSAATPDSLAGYDLIVYGAGLYAGSVNGLALIKKARIKKLIVFTVGIADPSTADLSPVRTKILSCSSASDASIFHLWGRMDYGKLGFAHKRMLGAVKLMLGGKNPSTLSDNERVLLSAISTPADYLNIEAIEPIIRRAKEILGEG